MLEQYVYPVTIVLDRYQGVYSGAPWTAWNEYADGVPDAIDADDCSCAEFWARDEHGPVGRGLTPDSALADLYWQLNELKDDQDGTPLRDNPSR